MSVLSPIGRTFLATLATTGVFGLVLLASSGYAQIVRAADAQASLIGPLPANLHAAIEGNAIRPFRINVPEAALVDLRRRIAATKWPEQETVSDATQGVQPSTRLRRPLAVWDCAGTKPFRNRQGRNRAS